MTLGWKKTEKILNNSVNPVVENDYSFKQNSSKEVSSEMNNTENKRSSDTTTGASFVPEESNISLDNLIVSASIRDRIEGALNKIRFSEVLYKEWGLDTIDDSGKKVAINLFGRPGTGKTFCSKAIANFLGKKIITVNYAEIESKYVGDTPKNITAAFKKAKETDSVLFFDEADSILGKRLTNVTQSADHGVNVSRSVMLLQLDKFDGIVLFATNLASNYDSAFVRRILAHIEFELPDLGSRTRLWEYLIPDKLPIEAGITPEWLAEQSDGLSGGEIKNVVLSSASKAVSRLGDDKIVKKSDFVFEIKNSLEAKRKIASSNQSDKKRTIVEKEITPEELPTDAKIKYEKTIYNLENESIDEKHINTNP